MKLSRLELSCSSTWCHSQWEIA